MSAQPILVVLAVADVPKAVAFYRAAFGWTVDVDAAVYVELETPGPFSVGLYLREGYARNTGRLPIAVAPGEVGPFEMYLRVDDLPRAVASVVAAGGRLLSPAALRPWGHEVAYLADPDGNVLALAITTGRDSAWPAAGSPGSQESASQVRDTTGRGRVEVDRHLGAPTPCGERAHASPRCDTPS